jgi:hypothetical protein
MSTIISREEKIKEVITIDMVQERLCRLNKFGWSITKYLYTPQIVPQKKTQVCFMENFRELPQNVHTLIIEKLRGNMKTWCIQYKSLIIDAFELTSINIGLSS